VKRGDEPKGHISSRGGRKNRSYKVKAPLPSPKTLKRSSKTPVLLLGARKKKVEWVAFQGCFTLKDGLVVRGGRKNDPFSVGKPLGLKKGDRLSGKKSVAVLF